MYQKATVCYVYLELKLSKLVDIVRTVCQRLSIKCNPIFGTRGGPISRLRQTTKYQFEQFIL